MKTVNVEQGTKEWLSWRKSVITATDASAIMGCNPWVTPYKCWQRKLGLVEEVPVNAAMEKGKRLEPVARDAFISETGIEMNPSVIESSESSFLGASLDGISEDKSAILEIKCGGPELFRKASQGLIPDYYMAQMQHQLIVTRAKICYYYAYLDGKGILVEVLPDSSFEEKYMGVAKDFWKKIACFEHPPLSFGDYKDMNDNLSWNEYASMYREISSNIKALEEKKEYARKKIIEMCGNESCTGSGLKVMKQMMKGRISYDDIPQLHGVDMDKYRKSPTLSWKIFVDSESA